MAIVIPHAPEEALLDLILAPNMTLKLFTNDVESGLSEAQIEAITAASFTEATFTGYSSKALTGGSWTTTQGDPSSGTYAQQTFTRTSTGAQQTVRGYYMIRTTGGALCWYEYFTGPIITENNGDAVVLTPTFTLDDQEATVTARGIIAKQTLTSNSSGYTTSSTTDFALSNVDVDSTRCYRINLHSPFGLSANSARWSVKVQENASDLALLGEFTADGAGGIFDVFDGSIIWEPDTGTQDLTVVATEASGAATLTLTASASAPRTFWVEDIGPRLP